MDWLRKLWNWKKNADALDAVRAEIDVTRSQIEAARSERERLRAENESLSRQSDAADKAIAKLRKRCSNDLLAAHLVGSVELVELMERAAIADRDGILDFAELEMQLQHQVTKLGNAALGALIELGDDEKKPSAEVTCPDSGANDRC